VRWHNIARRATVGNHQVAGRWRGRVRTDHLVARVIEPDSHS
jgi:hypothetical protein